MEPLRAAELHPSSDVVGLRIRLERQSLLIQTLLMILLEKKVVDEAEFREWLDYVDELDGAKDGRLKEDRSPVACPACKRNNPRQASRCQYCGHELTPDFLQHRPDE